MQRSYNVIYGSGVNYGNTDLPFTSHQTDNWPVSCCYGRGARRLSRLFARTDAGGRRTGADSYRTVFWESNEFWLGFKSEGGGRTNAAEGGISYLFPSPTQCQDNLIFFFTFGEQNLPPPPPLFALSICISKKSHRDLLCIFTSD